MTDPIADMLTRVRNALVARKTYVDVPASKIKAQIARIMLENGYVRDVRYRESGPQGELRIYLKYNQDHSGVIEGLRRISRPSRRVYVTGASLPRVMGGFGTAVISTSQGLLTDKECRKRGVGGEVICHIW